MDSIAVHYPKEKIDVLFCTEVDSTEVKGNFTIPYYDSLYPLTVEDDAKPKIRIMALAKRDTKMTFTLREDLMSRGFPSMWVEARTSDGGAKLLVGGLYREWDSSGDKTIEGQFQRMRIFTEQLQNANDDCERVVVVGDINLCQLSWNNENYRYLFILFRSRPKIVRYIYHVMLSFN